MHKLRVGILFGGRSSEHEISLRSARSVVQALDRTRFAATLIGIDHHGRWHVLDEPQFLALTNVALPALGDGGPEVLLPPVPSSGELIDLTPRAPIDRLDVVFPVLHGTLGEDGTVQGLLELADIPYVGAGVLGSAVAMDKDVQKRLLRDARIPIVPFIAATQSAWQSDPEDIRHAASKLGYPLFVKPANAGSSVGVAKVRAATELDDAVVAAFAYDLKILIEKGIDAREIECSVLGNEHPEASLPGEVCPHADFYSYEAKYVDEHGATFRIPAPLDESQTIAVRELAIRTFRVLECEGMARVDFFLDRVTGTIYVNEINSIPGFTNISVYPKLWEISGLSYTDLISRLLDLAIERHARRRQRQTVYRPKT
ncbi:MAG TPA: D-alanine--D-alanine ligase [Candidatus Binatia bacterium]|nr:D-alanine--D-alanine ligase [Candidatus Binatia bacterium]